MKPERKKVLVLDVGGTNVKIHATHSGQLVKIPSGPKMTAGQMVAAVKKVTAGWEYDVVSIGYPGPVAKNKPLREPHNLGGGWMRHDFKKAFGRPVKIVNDAAMQALGGHRGGHMLFLGLGTGLGSTLVVDDLLLPLELAHLPYKKNRTYEEYLGNAGLERLGEKKWLANVFTVIELLKNALIAEYVVVGGGNSRLIKKYPPGVEPGKNSNAIRGGERLWNKR
ncbi:MAG: ROK family protein [Verrucomicrobiota bacterium]|jgi:polyphosphate glucokinase